jgi:hypothetical protein
LSPATTQRQSRSLSRQRPNDEGLDHGLGNDEQGALVVEMRQSFQQPMRAEFSPAVAQRESPTSWAPGYPR